MPAEAVTLPPDASGSPPPASAESVAAAAARTTVSVSALPTGDPQPPAKPGSARDRMAQDLSKRFGGEQPAPAERPGKAAPQRPATQAGKPAPEETSPERPLTGTEEAPPEPGEEAAAAAEAPPAGKGTPQPGKKTSPWKLVDQFKQRATAAEARVLELEKQVMAPEKAKAERERVEALEKQANEMREELRYHNAEKYDPDILKANADYEDAWKRALGELKELTVPGENGAAARPLTAQDILDLVNMPLGQAREVAEKVFGSFANDVMAHRKEIKNLFEQRSAKIEELKKTGATRDQQRQEQIQKALSDVQAAVKTTYEAGVAEGLEHPFLGKFLKPQEGNETWNTSLEKATKFVDDGLKQNAFARSMTPEQRAEVVKHHAAIRNRAIAYTTLKSEVARLTKALSERDAELKQFKDTEPEAGGRNGQGAPARLKGIAAIGQALGNISK